jgi:serine protease Do
VNKEIRMTGRIVASATAAALAAVGAGTLATGAEIQSPAWTDSDVAIAAGLPDAQQAVKVFRMSGTHIGVGIRDLNDDELKAGKTSGVVIETVDTDSPAQKAGFKAGDIVVEFDGERVRSSQQLTRLVQETVSGRPVQAIVMRDGQRTTLTVQPQSAEPFKYWNDSGADVFSLPKLSPPMVLKRDGWPDIEGLLARPGGQLGISVDELSPQLSEYFGTKDGVLVTTVRDNSNASRAGVKAGDVITSLNGGAVTTGSELRRRAQRLESGDEFTVGIVRDKKPMTLKGKIEAPPPSKRPTVRTIV